MDVFTMRKKVQKILEAEGVVPHKLADDERGPLELTSLQLNSWLQTFSRLLHVEELQMSFDIGMYDMTVTHPLEVCFGVGTGRLYRLEVPGVAERRPSVLRGDAVLVIGAGGRFKAYAHQVRLDKVDLSFHSDFDNKPPFDVKFFFTRTPLKLMHRALGDEQGRISCIYSRATPALNGQALPARRTSARSALNAEQGKFVDAVVRARRVADIPLTGPELELAAQLSGPSSESRERRLRKFGPTLLYHQTDLESAKKILDSGKMFRGRSGALGGGIYFAQSPDETDRKALHHGVILECEVKLGNIKRLHACDHNITYTQLQQEGYDSVLCDVFSSGPEHVVYNFDQVRPMGTVEHGSRRRSRRPARRPAGRPPAFPFPLLLWGPPGTGKTTTVVAAICEVIQCKPARVLVTAPSNSAADLLCERLARHGVGTGMMFRLNGMLRNFEDMPMAVRPYTRHSQLNGFEVPPLPDLMRYQVVVSTCTSAGYLASRSGVPGWFTHAFVDEAAQAAEPEALIPASVLEPGGLLVLAGDFKQLGPMIRSPVAASYGLDTSLLERVVQHIGLGHARVYRLLESYRAHPSILRLYNETVYDSMLQCRCPASSNDMMSWPLLPVDAAGRRQPVIFHHIAGEEERVPESPSWSNPAEVEVLRYYVQELTSHGVAPSDVGIISPYQLQCARVKLMCRTQQFGATVGTTEQFQGREHRVILVSTVRSLAESEVPRDLRFALGFVGNYKRSNVALSRARSALILVGNLRLLSMDAHWHKVIDIAQRMGCCRGEAFELQEPLVVDDQVRGQRSSAHFELAARPWHVLE